MRERPVEFNMSVIAGLLKARGVVRMRHDDIELWILLPRLLYGLKYEFPSFLGREEVNQEIPTHGNLRVAYLVVVPVLEELDQCPHDRANDNGAAFKPFNITLSTIYMCEHSRNVDGTNHCPLCNDHRYQSCESWRSALNTTPGGTGSMTGIQDGQGCLLIERSKLSESSTSSNQSNVTKQLTLTSFARIWTFLYSPNLQMIGIIRRKKVYFL